MSDFEIQILKDVIKSTRDITREGECHFVSSERCKRCPLRTVKSKQLTSLVCITDYQATSKQQDIVIERRARRMLIKEILKELLSE